MRVLVGRLCRLGRLQVTVRNLLQDLLYPTYVRTEDMSVSDYFCFVGAFFFRSDSDLSEQPRDTK